MRFASLARGSAVKRFVADVETLSYETTRLGLASQLRRCFGIEQVDVDPVAGTVSIRFDETSLTPTSVGLLIAECGYRCTRGTVVSADGDDWRPIVPPASRAH